jgi:DNA repair exonuclease SbcCD nuclease subunit
MGKLNIATKFELIKEENELGDAFASVSLNPFIQWATIVVTDDLPNGNKERVPLDEYDNLIKSGVHAPIKMAEEEISEGHEEAYGRPIGTITQLVQEGNKLIALAALWKKERPEDIKLLKKMYSDGKPPNVSWEISFKEAELGEDGVTTLKGLYLNGLAVVGVPAYKGRTQFVAMSSKNKEKEDFSVEELEKLKTQVSNLETDVDKLTKENKEKDETLAEKDVELEALREFKADTERKNEEVERFAAIKEKFSEAEIEKDDEYFEKKKEILLGLDENALDFMIQEMVAFSELTDESKAELKKKAKVPKLNSEKEVTLTPKELGQMLRDDKKK